MAFWTRKTTLIGRGAYAKVKKVKAKPGAKQRVIKTIPFQLTREQATRAVEAVREFRSALKREQIPTISTGVYAIKKGNSYRLSMIQQFVPKEKMLGSFLKKCSSQEAIWAYEEVTKLFEKIMQINKTQETLGADFVTSNLAVIDGKLTLLDIFPPLTPNAKKTTEEIGIRQNIRTIKALRKKIKDKFNPQKITLKEKRRKKFVKLTSKFIQLRPELRDQILSIAAQVKVP